MSLPEIIYLFIITYINNSYEILILKFLLLNMQTFFYWFFFNTFYGKSIVMSLINTINLIKPRAIDFNHSNLQASAIDGAYNQENPIIFNLMKKKVNNLVESDDLLIDDILNTDQYDKNDFNYLIDFFLNFSNLYIWFMLPFLIIILIFFSLHGLLGLYSAYVDYFQKNMDHVNSYRAFIPVLFIFLLFIFIIFSLLFLFISFYFIYILWFLYF